MRKVVFGGMLGVIALFAVDAAAAPIDNPEADGVTTWAVETIVTAGATMSFNATCKFGIDGGAVYGTLTSTGTFTGDNTYSFPVNSTGCVVGGSTISATLQIRNASGTFNAQNAGGASVPWTMDVRVKFTGGALGGSCITGWANGVAINQKTSLNYAYNTGWFHSASGGFTLPAFAGASCNSNGSAVNSAFNLGTSGAASIDWDYGAITSPAILRGS